LHQIIYERFFRIYRQSFRAILKKIEGQFMVEVSQLSTAKALGERKIIKLILDSLDPMPNMLLPFGDDASALNIGNNNVAIINVDMLVAKTDVPKNMTIWQASRKAVIMNLSDLAAKGAKPLVLLASIGVPPSLTENEIKQIGEGLNAGAREYDTYVLGGDTNEASDLIISCTALGICKRNELIKRTGTIPGDYLAVTGSFGKTAAGLKIMKENISAQKSRQILVESVLMPKARVKEGIALAKSHSATASIDSSDGLAWSLYELSKANNLGFHIERIPVTPETEDFAELHNLEPLELALYGGEEYELIVTVNPEVWENAKNAVESVGGNLIKIGYATKKQKIVVASNGTVISVNALGWEHFKTK
jgi:thiamine-monophosphate kinase